MAKKNQKINLVLTLADYTPTREVGGKKQAQVDAAGNPVVLKIFNTKLPVLGRSRDFRIYTKEPTEKQILVDFFALEGVTELPINVSPVTFKNDKGESVTVYDVWCELDEIHKVKLKPADDAKGIFAMAIKEIADNYQLPEKYAKIRQERYDAMMANKKKQSESKKDDLPF